MPMLRSFAVAALIIGVACSGGSTGYSPPPPPNPPAVPPPPPPPPLPPPPPAPTIGVSVNDNSFSPSNGSLASGGKVTWTWNGGSTHNVTFEDGQHNSGNQTSGATHERTFPTVTTSTTFRYRCTLHSTSFTSGMTGQVVVSP
ncbi:MAG TPA: plastocyanin/azurin family copper-binding protein [Gemmatimonadales bacterium]|nr:plastocyanin/azurin family copper-binding protein [Gemmatimonadales bacterium]